jgi:hypothetical protein
MPTTRPCTAIFLREINSATCCTYEQDKKRALQNENAQISLHKYLARNRSLKYRHALQKALDAKTCDELNEHFADMKKARYEEWREFIMPVIGAIVGLSFGWLIIKLRSDKVELERRPEKEGEGKRKEENRVKEAERKKADEEFEQQLKNIEYWMLERVGSKRMRGRCKDRYCRWSPLNSCTDRRREYIIFSSIQVDFVILKTVVNLCVSRLQIMLDFAQVCCPFIPP